jgi:3-phenylpropionate/trans-cinnamate dioxygenase ferredoxin subunit
MFEPVGSISEIATGTMRAYDVGGARVTVASAGDALYAFDDTCTHMGCSLARGRLEGTTVTCACHGSQFDITTGSVLRGPASRPVRARSVRVEGDEVAVET